ncbi:aminotransferase class V-fold PLP-dependent enzyme [Lachnospiraceae bacterium PAL227]|uniref:Aminotransferase class V-fold PLP-dependent enzyme n=1 Tax=Ohessyouella blattaphilus TaxID=2949333 RepID=A0ABT1EL47_9FIRM|nr:aminotransferase class V-fold PLP-dependent enzyme [Ohessyouella blattaphilus]MCP1111435.1 aminotransferase class V-fold PLP-dependent enzyme [Ohessyouella blattaphilus]MCR8564829.1 aminotransferase class V-fold PLP-dependent enzyme [Ohessyouella blattaphilus]
MARFVERGIYFVVDAIQGLGVLPIDLCELEIDFLISGFFKWLLGPDGLAFTYIRQEILEELRVPVAGWAGMQNKFDYYTYSYDLAGDASRFETGNMNFSAIAGAIEALQYTQGMESVIYNRIHELKTMLRYELSLIKGVQILSPVQKEESGILYFKLPETEKKYLELSENGLVCTFRDGIRVSVHFYNNSEDIARLIEYLQ